MARSSVGLCASFAIVLSAAPALADSSYCARLGENDHYSSKGQRLTSVGAVIQQDRANYHRFGRPDPEDQGDPVFSNKASRDLLNSRVDDNALSPAERREIVEGAPYVCLSVTDDGHAYITSIR
ncbi:hypothetical protein IHQ68_09885 [Chelatococcus sambhunathii]|uniref:Uncharacterized protein n=1 Tax=Chelatococcus sambhunathii TaxID=363953 RepID=A0ABU1DFN6_9HYPH|nr:hypothetical protein [Chelatococcus sambhunathii]MDR4306927.1 hypothetical protein [Chelatococcus sambhunathii]